MLTASIVVVTWNGERLVSPCLEAAAQQAMPADEYELLVVDNRSTDRTAELVRAQFPSVRVIEAATNLGYAGGANVGWRAASGRILALLNQDTVPRPGWLPALAAALEDPTVGVAGSKILDMDGITIQHAGARFDWPLVQGTHRGGGEEDTGQYDEPCDVEYVTGAALAVRRDVVERIGLFDEGYYPGYFEDVDLCVRARRAGYRVVYVPQAVALHHLSASFDQSPLGRGPVVHRNRLRFILKTFSPDQIVEEFIPAEIARLPALYEEELRSIGLACTQAQVAWPSLASAFHRPLHLAEALRVSKALRALHEAVAGQQAQMLCRTGGGGE